MSITPGAVVLASDAANGAVLQKVVPTISDRTRRRDAVDALRTCQAVRRRTTIVVRGELPLLSGHFDCIDIASLPLDGGAGEGTHGDGAEAALLIVQAPVYDTLTVVGPEDVRLPLKLDLDAVAAVIDSLFILSPEVRKRACSLAWGAFVARKTQHPASAAPEAFRSRWDRPDFAWHDWSALTAWLGARAA